jgi:hypothetical protein
MGWGGKHPLDVPVFVVSSSVPQEWVYDGSPFTFVTDGLEAPWGKRKRLPATRTSVWAPRASCSSASERDSWTRSTSIWCPFCSGWRRHVACATTQTKEAMEMPKVSRDSAPQRQEAGPVVDLRGELDGYTVSFTSVLEDLDATPLMKGLPDDRCPCPHWGYVLKGKMTARYADRDEVFEAGDAFYTPPGHVPVQHEPGTEFVWFSPSDELRAAEAVMVKNMQAMRDGATP